MHTDAQPSTNPTLNKRNRHWYRKLEEQIEVRQDQQEQEEEEKEEKGEEEDTLPETLDRTPQDREMHGMHKSHRIFHRRQAKANNILTVSVEVINTIDPNGNIIAQQTVTPAAPVAPAAVSTDPAVPSVLAVPTVPAVPAVPPMPTDAIPTVPAVPAFPSDLTVPAYPFVSAESVPSASSSQQSPVTSGSPAASSTPVLPSSSFSSISNSTISSTSSSSPLGGGGASSTSGSVTSSSVGSSPSASSSPSSSSSTLVTSSSSSSATSSASTSASASTSVSSSSSSSNGFFGGVGGGSGSGSPTAAAPPAATSSSAGTPVAGESSSTSLGTPQVVGTVFGSLAGAALIFALLLFLLKRHKQKKQSAPLQLPEDDHSVNQAMTQPDRHTSYVAPSFLNRFSGASRLTTETASTGGEKSFQRISGRKLPSAFSEGLTSEQFSRGDGALSGSSFYKDDKGIYGGPGVISQDFALSKEVDVSSSTGAMGNQELVRPSPARTPVLHHPDDAPVFGASRNGGGSTLSPPLTPNPDYPSTRGSLGRSHLSHDGSRSSRFTENV